MNTHILPKFLRIFAIVLIFTTVPLVAQETAVLAGGCFWGMEGVFEHVEGVLDVVSGYAGGKAEVANYQDVSSGTTDHAESIQITYDPQKISYESLLKVFFRIAHDPTQLNYQGPDHGRQYRSVVFYSSEDQRRKAEKMISNLEQQQVFKDPIVTELDPLTRFYPAEGYHQDFMHKNPLYPYVVYWDWPKIQHLSRTYPDLYVENAWEKSIE